MLVVVLSSTNTPPSQRPRAPVSRDTHSSSRQSGQGGGPSEEEVGAPSIAAVKGSAPDPAQGAVYQCISLSRQR